LPVMPVIAYMSLLRMIVVKRRPQAGLGSQRKRCEAF
jgi:hypothetical protein